MRVTDVAKRPNERADRPVSTLNSVNQLGPPTPSTRSLRDLPSNDSKWWRYPAGTLTADTAPRSKLDSSCSRMMCGSFRDELQPALPAVAGYSARPSATSRYPCVDSSRTASTPVRANLET